MNKDFVERLRAAFEEASMAEVGRRLKIPHATVRNYFQGRLPSAEVLIKIAKETGVSLNWLLMGTGEKYAGQVGQIGLGRLIEDKIRQIIDLEIKGLVEKGQPVESFVNAFDVDAAVRQFNDPQLVMQAWFQHENRVLPQDYGIVFFRGWESFSEKDKAQAIIDAKKALDARFAWATVKRQYVGTQSGKFTIRKFVV